MERLGQPKVDANKGAPYFADNPLDPGGASNLCIGSQDPNLRPPYSSTGGRPGLLGPYQLLAI